MKPEQLKQIAQELLNQEIDIDQFVGKMVAANQPDSAEVDSAIVDLDRSRRCGFPEVIYGEGKSVESIVAIANKLTEHGQDVLATRIDVETAKKVCDQIRDAVYNPDARTLRVTNSATELTGSVAVVSAGTTDLPVAMEARETLDWMGVNTCLIQDIGVAGPQRLISRLDQICGHDAIVVAAGMEGALPSVVGGHVDCPVIAVPTSVGYGASFGGVSALLSMLNSCASNVAVVNIDAGFKAGYVAGMIAKRKATLTSP